MGGTNHPDSPSAAAATRRPDPPAGGASPADATRAGSQMDSGSEQDFSLAGPAGTIDTPRGSSANLGPNEGTIEIAGGSTGGGVHRHDATQASGAGTVEGARRTGASGPVLAGFADYELIGEIARGGMGVVYRARQISLNRIVAVKMILAGQLASEADVQRFRSEAEAAANLQHPNIVSIYEVGEYGGQHYFSMQFIDGRSLSDVVREGLLPARRAARVVQTVVDAVQYAHDQGILHRDLKPSNILIDAHSEPHLTDFGVAKRLSGESQLTATGAILGTPGYMPPEQAAGKREVGPAADVYALGGILYELLTGRPPFKGERIVDVLMQVMNVEPVNPQLLNPSVPPDLATICLKCLEKDPARRYPTAAALSADLGRWLEGEPIEARPTGRWERGWRWCKRSPLVASLLASLVIIGIAAFVGVTSQWLVAQSALRRMQEAQAERAATQVNALLQAAPESLAAMLVNLQPYRDEIEPRLRELVAQTDLPDQDRLRASLALLPSDPSQVDYLRERLLSVSLAELLAVREALAPYRESLSKELWQTLEDADGDAGQRFAAGLVLAGYDPGDERSISARWREQAPFLSKKLLDSIAADPSAYDPLVKALLPARQALYEPLAAAFCDPQQPESVRAIATSILVNYAASQPAQLASLLLDADPRQYVSIQPRLSSSSPEAVAMLAAELERNAASDATDDERDRLARRQAQAAVALLQFGQTERFWPLLTHSDDPRLRSWLIELLARLAADPALLLAQLPIEQDVSVRRALILALGNYDPEALLPEVRAATLERCRELFATDADPGIHAAAEWLLVHWQQPAGKPPQETTPPTNSGWQLAAEDHTLAVIDGRASFTMGSSATEPRRSVAEKPHAMTVGRRFALGTKEVTQAQFRRFIRDTGLRMPPITRKHSPDEQGPMTMVTWYRAAQYCRWLSEQAGVSEDQMCYPPIDQIKDGMTPIPDYLQRTGFRLPTEAEWEFACRAGSKTSRAFGSSEELLPRYAWYLTNAEDRTWPAGSLKPNDFGLFDMYGNTWEWCQESWNSYWQTSASKDQSDLSAVTDGSNRVLRGGSFDSPPKAVRSAYRDRLEKAQFGSDEIGFRIARTIPE